MTRKPFALFFLVLFIQTVLYPVVIFHFYVDNATTDNARSLPVDFPDNGSACYFGLSNNEEENHHEKTGPIQEEHFHKTDFDSVQLSLSARFGLTPDHKSTHQETATPPPEFA